MTAESLIAAVRAGQPDALGELLAAYREYLRLLAQIQSDRRLRAKVDASDVVQEVLLQAQQHFPQFRGTTERELAAWLRRILASCLAKVSRHFRGTKRRQVQLEREIEDVSSAIGARLVEHASPSELAMQREQGVLLANALARLPDDYRRVIVLRHVQGHTFPEVARRMGRSVDSVKKLWARGLGQLRANWGDHS